MTYSRREFLRCLALGGAVVAGELWIPGQRVISLPALPSARLSGFAELMQARHDSLDDSLVETVRVYRSDWGTIKSTDEYMAALDAVWRDAVVKS